MELHHMPPQAAPNPPPQKSSTLKVVMLGCGIALLAFFVIVIAFWFFVMRPRIIKLQAEAEEAAVESTISAVREAIILKYAESIVEGVDNPHYPATLDDNPDGPCMSCFSNVFDESLVNTNWVKSGLTYTHKGKVKFVYNPAEGTFEKQ